MKTVYSSCRICTYCSFKFEVEDNQVTSFQPDAEHPLSKGYCCPKGNSAIEFMQGTNGERLLNSLKKSDDGNFTQVDTLAAATEAGEKIKAIVDEHGPRSVALFFGTGAYTNTLGSALCKAWLHAIGTPNLYSTMTIDQSNHWLTAARMGIFLGGVPHVEDIDVGLIAGSNPLVSHIGWPVTPLYGPNPGENLRAGRERGQKLIVVDPRETETAKQAALHLQIVPGEDATLYAGIIHQLFKHGWINREFTDRFATHVDRLEAMVKVFDEEFVCQRVGIDKDKLRQAANMLGEARKPFCGSTTGTSMAPDSNLADFLLAAINSLLGGYRRDGDLIRNQMAMMGGTYAAESLIAPRRTWEQGVKCRTQDVGHIYGEFPSALLPDEILKPGEDKIRAVIVFAGNPAMAFVDPEKTLAAFNDLDLLITLDHSHTETAELSDYVFATSVMHEQHALSSGFEFSMPETYAQYFRPVVEKPETVAHDWEVFWAISRAMGLQLELKHMIPGSIFSKAPSAGGIDMQTMPTSEDLIRALCDINPLVEFEDLKAAPRGIKPDIPEARVGPAKTEDDGRRLELCPDDIAEDLQNLSARPPVLSRYRLASRRIIPVLNSALRNSNFAQSKFQENFAYMNPQDMSEDALSDGNRIDVATDTGKITVTVRTDASLRRGVISIPHCYGSPHKEKDGINGSYTGHLIALEPDKSEAINFMTHNTGIPISVSLSQ